MSTNSPYGSPSNQPNPGQARPYDAAGHQYAPYQGQQYNGPQYQGTPFQGQQYQETPYQGQQYKVPAGATTYGPVTDAPQPVSAKKSRVSLASIVMVCLGAAAIFIALVLSASHDFGAERLNWLAAACGIGLLLVVSALVAFPSSRRAFREAKAQGDAVSARKHMNTLVIAFVAIPLSGYLSFSNGVPAVRDIIDGPQTITVASCSYEQGSHRQSRRRGGGRTVYDNYFTMTLTDNTTRTTKIETPTSNAIQNRGGNYAALYEACKLRSGSATMTLTVYEHSWIIVDARVD